MRKNEPGSESGQLEEWKKMEDKMIGIDTSSGANRHLIQRKACIRLLEYASISGFYLYHNRYIRIHY